MFEADPQVQKMVNDLYDHCLTLDRGDTLMWDKAESLTGLARFSDEVRFHYVIKRLRRRMMLDRQIVMRPARGVGLRLLTDDECVTVVGEDRNRRIYRQARRGKREMQCANRDKLSVHSQRVMASTVDRFTLLQKSARAGVKEIVKKCEALPRRVVAAK